MTPQDLATTTAHGRHAAAHVAAIAESARPAVRSNLKRAAGIAAGHPSEWDRFPWHRLDVAGLEAVRNGLAGRYRPATVNASLAAVRGVLRRAWHAGELSRADYERRLDALRAVGGGSAPGRALSPAQAAALFRACPQTAAGARDAALFAVLYGCGLRRAEAAALDLEDLDREAWTLTVNGKGRRQRLAYLASGAREALEAWLAVRGEHAGRVFQPVRKDGRIDRSAGMSGRSIARRVERRSEQAGIGRCSAHVLRRSFATQLLGAGNDLAVTADLMGHARVDTTRRYDRRGEEAKRQAAATLAVPYAAPVAKRAGHEEGGS